MGRHDEWVARDAAVVWHGFTQMDDVRRRTRRSSSSGRGPRADRRRRSPLPRRHLVAVGQHARPRGPRARRRRCASRSTAARTRRCSATATVRWSSWPRRSHAVVPVDDPHFLFASDGAAAVEQALKIAFQYWVNQGVPAARQFLAFGGAYHGDTIGALSLGDGGFGTDLFDPLRFPVLRAPQLRRSRLLRHRASPWSRRTPPSSRRWSSSRSCRARRACSSPIPTTSRALGDACREPRRAAHLRRGRDRASGAPARCSPRSSAASGPISSCSARASPAATCRCRRRSRSGRCSTRSSAPTSVRAHAVPRALVRRERAGGRGGAPPPRAARGVVGARATSGPAPTSCAALLDDRVAPHARGRRGAPVRARWAASSWRPPARGHAWGRRVCAARGRPRRAAPPARRRRRAHAAAHGDVGRAAPHRARARRARSTRSSHDDRSRRRDDRSDWSDWADGERGAHRGRGSVARTPRRSTRRTPARRHAGWSCRSRRTTTSGSPSTPRCVAAAHAAIDRWGTGAGAARLIVGSRPVHDELETELATWKGTEAAVLFTHRVRRQPRGARHLRRARHPRVLRRAQPRVAHRRATAVARAARRLPPRRRRPRRRAAARARTTPRAIVVSETVFSMDGDVAPVDKLAEVCAHHGALLVLDEAHAVLGPRSTRRSSPAPTHLRVGTLSKTLGALGGFVAGPTRFTDLLVNRARSYIFTTASTPADTAAALAALRVRALPRGRRAAWHGCAPTSTACGRGTRRRSCPSCAAPRRVRSPRPRRLARRGLLVTAIRPPTVPPGTSRLRVALSAAHTDRAGRPVGDRAGRALPGRLVTRPRTLVFVSGTATEVGKTWWTAATARELRRRGQRTSPPASRCSRVEPGRSPTREVLAAATGEDPYTVCSPHRTYPLAWAPPMAADELGERRFHHRRPHRRDRLARGHRRRAGRRRRRSTFADQRRRRQRRPRAPARTRPRGASSADAGFGTINAVRLSVTAFADFPVVVALNRFTTEPLPERNRAHLVDRDGLDVVTEPRVLAARLRLPS